MINRQSTNACDSAGPIATFETTDLSLASFLRCRKFSVGDISQRGGKTVFSFQDSEELRRSVLDFANDAMVPVRSFCNTLRDFKALTR